MHERRILNVQLRACLEEEPSMVRPSPTRWPWTVDSWRPTPVPSRALPEADCFPSGAFQPAGQQHGIGEPPTALSGVPEAALSGLTLSKARSSLQMKSLRCEADRRADRELPQCGCYRWEVGVDTQAEPPTHCHLDGPP